MIWVGLDLHKKYITACALDEAGGLVAEHRRLPADAEAVVAWLTGLGGPVTVAMEATLSWAWLHDQLSAAGLAAVAAHSYQVKLIWQARAMSRITHPYAVGNHLDPRTGLAGFRTRGTSAGVG